MRINRRESITGLLALPLLASVLCREARASGTLPLNADTLGVNTHMGQGQPPAKVAEALRLTGLRHIRDSVLPPSILATLVPAMQGTVRLTAVVGGRRPIKALIIALEAIERKWPGILAAIEGPNEVNNFPFPYKGLSGSPAAVAFQSDLYAAVRASAPLHHLPVIAFTDLAFQDSASDFFNFHPYPPNGELLEPRIARMKARVAQSSSPTKPIQFTEFGYSTSEMNEERQAALLIAGCRAAVAAGIRRVFVYQLSDFYPDRDPAHPALGNHYGLFDLHYRPKKAALAIARILRP
ncbi:hypothetical protein [Sphingomonas sp.]|uniref:hypothetical protein n=1 Tax=Sphingomonas sp. TaxID=28214 RepID=UPI0025D36BA0|nr:hypothetical protein [Sphingomonas sp.]